MNPIIQSVLPLDHLLRLQGDLLPPRFDALLILNWDNGIN